MLTAPPPSRWSLSGSCNKCCAFQGCECSSFWLITSFLKIFLCQIFSFFFYFQPISGIFTQFHTVFPPFFFLSVASHTSGLCSSIASEQRNWTCVLYCKSDHSELWSLFISINRSCVISYIRFYWTKFRVMIVHIHAQPLYSIQSIHALTQGNYATVGSAIVAIAIVGRGGWAGLSSTVAI